MPYFLHTKLSGEHPAFRPNQVRVLLSMDYLVKRGIGCKATMREGCSNHQCVPAGRNAPYTRVTKLTFKRFVNSLVTGEPLYAALWAVSAAR